MVNIQRLLKLVSSETLFQRQLRTFINSVLMLIKRHQMDMSFGMSDQFFIEWFQVSWRKEEISQSLMGKEVGPFMERTLEMRTLNWSTQKREFYQWQMPDLTQMDLNFSLLLKPLLGLMVIMLCLEKSWADLKLWKSLRNLEPSLETP